MVGALGFVSCLALSGQGFHQTNNGIAADYASQMIVLHHEQMLVIALVHERQGFLKRLLERDCLGVGGAAS